MIWRFLIKLLGERIYTPQPIDEKALQEWLTNNYKDRGWMSYYSMRKKYLLNLLSHGVEGREYFETIGRLNELKSLSSNILTAQRKSEALAKKKLNA